MKVDIFVTRLVTEAIQIEAESIDSALQEFEKSDKLTSGRGTVLNAVFRANGHKPTIRHYPSCIDLDDINADFTPLVPLEIPSASSFEKAVEARIAHRMAKMRSVIEIVAYEMLTPEDLAIENERELSEVLESREYENEFAVFMEVLRWARRAIDLPDIIVHPPHRD